jgi:Smg protein
MFDVLSFVCESYWHPGALPGRELLQKKIVAAGFEGAEVDAALGFLDDVGASWSLMPLEVRGMRVLSAVELEALEPDALALWGQIVQSELLDPVQREWVLESILLRTDMPVDADALRVLVHLAFWVSGRFPDQEFWEFVVCEPSLVGH